MKGISVTSTIVLMAATLLTASCGSDDAYAPDTTTANAISFYPRTGSRAAIENAADMDAFDVWGGFDANIDNVFSQEKVSNTNGTWTYEGTQYWNPGKNYTFYAVYPYGLDVTTTDGGITINNFNCLGQTGDEAIDLMTATGTGDGDNPQPVRLNFTHQLTRVSIVARTEQGTAIVTSAELTGELTSVADITINGNAVTIENERTSPATINSGEQNISVGNTEATGILGDLMLFPQTISENNLQVTVTYHYSALDSETRTATLPYTTLQAGRHYTFTLIIQPDGRIHFDPPQINKWGEAQGGIIIVD